MRDFDWDEWYSRCPTLPPATPTIKRGDLISVENLDGSLWSLQVEEVVPKGNTISVRGAAVCRRIKNDF